MLFLIVFLCAIFVASTLGLLSAWSDFRGMIIPNAYPLGIIIAFAFAYAACALGANPEPFQKLSSHLIAGGAAFVITFTMTVTKLMGGGDSKLIVAYAFWMGVLNTAMFLFVMALVGAGLALVTIVIRRIKPFKTLKAGGWLARVQAGEAVIPYGIPIVAGALYIFCAENYASVATVKAFVMPTE